LPARIIDYNYNETATALEHRPWTGTFPQLSRQLGLLIIFCQATITCDSVRVILFYNELQMSTYVADKRLQWTRGLPVFIAVWRLHVCRKIKF